MAEYGHSFNPLSMRGVKKSKIEDIEAVKAEIAKYVYDEMLDHIGSGKSPVQGGPWKRELSAAYKKIKSKESSAGFANLELTGELLDSLKVEFVGDRLDIYVEGGSDLIGKAEGNNIGSYGKRSANRSKARRFLPLSRERLNDEIRNGIKDIAKEFMSDG